MNINLKFFSFQRKISISKQWVQFGIIVATILGSTIIAYWTSGVMLFWLDVLIVGLAVVIALIIQPNLGYLLIFLGGMWVSIVGPSNINAAVIVVALMVGLWLLKILVIRNDFQ